MSIVALAVLAVSASPVVAAAADHVINVPAVSFVAHNSSVTYERNASDWGTLSDATGRFYAAVPFVHLDRSVCSFSLYVRDNDLDRDARARLLRKGTGAGAAFQPVVTIADVASSGTSNDMLTWTTTTIDKPAVRGSYLYFVELETHNTLQVLGVRIVYRATC